MGKKYNDKSLFGVKSYDRGAGGYTQGYDDYLIDIMDRVLSVDCVLRKQGVSVWKQASTKGGEYKELTALSTTDSHTRWKTKPSMAVLRCWH